MPKIAYKDLEYLENTIACQNRIMRLTRILFQATDDIEAKEALADIYTCAKNTKQEFIEKMQELKED